MRPTRSQKGSCGLVAAQEGWHPLQDSNLRPLAPEASALFAELRGHRSNTHSKRLLSALSKASCRQGRAVGGLMFCPWAVAAIMAHAVGALGDPPTRVW